VNHWLIGSMITTAVTVTNVALIRVIWLAGLKQTLRDALPHQRPAILRAYAACQPPPLRPPHRPGPRRSRRRWPRRTTNHRSTD
jgi:hypothetical protein